MQIEEQCVSLELAKRMKELGFEQESLFYWYTNTGEVVYFDEPGAAETRQNPNFKDVILPAYTVAELGEMLPPKIDDRFLTMQKGFPIMPFGVAYCADKISENLYLQNDKKEADARAKMLICLAENNLITPKEL